MSTIKIVFVVFLQTWHQSICGVGPFAGCHVAVWFSVAITRRFHLHICNLELHSGTKLYKAVYFYNYSIIAFDFDNCIKEISMFW